MPLKPRPLLPRSLLSSNRESEACRKKLGSLRLDVFSLLGTCLSSHIGCWIGEGQCLTNGRVMPDADALSLAMVSQEFTG